MLQEPAESKLRCKSHQVALAQEAFLLVHDRSTRGYPRRDRILPKARLRNGALRTNSSGMPGINKLYQKYIKEIEKWEKNVYI